MCGGGGNLEANLTRSIHGMKIISLRIVYKRLITVDMSLCKDIKINRINTP